MGAVCLQPSPLGCSRLPAPSHVCPAHMNAHVWGRRGTGSGWLAPGGAPPALLWDGCRLWTQV